MAELYALVRVDKPAGETADGALFIIRGGLEWQQVPWCDPWDCDHVEEMCVNCVDVWANDYAIRLPEGIDE